MNFLERFKDRTGGVIVSVIASIIFCCCGAVMAFYISPRQALEANRIANLPQMDAAFVIDAEPGEDLLVSGRLVDNRVSVEDTEFVAHKLERWTVTLPDEDSNSTTPTGKWSTVEFISPSLTFQVTGETFNILASEDAQFSGPLHEDVIPGEGPESASDGTEDLRDGTLRFKGFFDGDIITVLGVKASTGGIIPDQLFFGDRVEFEESEADAAKGLLFGGIFMLACAPIILIGGSLGALLGRRRRKLF